MESVASVTYEPIPPTPVWQQVLCCILFVLVSFGVGALGSLGMRLSDSQWFDDLKAPPLAPPSWLFAPVWGVLYVVMGISVFFVWRERLAPQPTALMDTSTTYSPGINPKFRLEVEWCFTIWAVQLALNGLWPWLFFGLQRLLASFVEIIVLLLMIILCIYEFWPITIVGACLLIPYAIWVAFASYLNGGYYFLNK